MFFKWGMVKRNAMRFRLIWTFLRMWWFAGPARWFLIFRKYPMLLPICLVKEGATSTQTGEYISTSRGIHKNLTKWSIKWYIFVQTRKSNPHWLGLSAQNMEFSVKYFEIDATSDPKSRNSVAVPYICQTLWFNEVPIHLCRLDFMSVLPSHAPSTRWGAFAATAAGVLYACSLMKIWINRHLQPDCLILHH